MYLVQELIQIPDGVLVIPEDGYLDTNYTWYQALIPSVVPLTADVTTANIPDNQVYADLTSSPNNLSPKTIKKIHYMVADPGYDDQSLYELSMSMGFQLVCPVRRYRNTPEERLQLVDFYRVSTGSGNLFKEKNIDRTAD